MTAFKASGAAGKDANGGKSLEYVLENFKAVQNPILHVVLLLLPWLILLTILIIYMRPNKPHDEEVIRVSGMLAAALSLFALHILMNMIPETVRKVWARNIIVEASFSDSLQRVEEGKDSKVTALSSRQLEDRFHQFMQKLQKMLNGPYQWAMGVGFFLLSFKWNPLFRDNIALFRNIYTLLTQVWDQTITWKIFKLFINDNVLYFANLMEFFIAFIIGLMAWRMVITSIYVWKLGKEFYLEPQIGHPDRSGGLSPLGNLCLWNAFIITIPTIYLGGWVLLRFFTEEGSPLSEESVTYTLLYLCLLLILVLFALVTFFLPLWKVHLIMEEWRNRKQARLDHLEYSINQLESRLLNEAEKLDQKEFESLQKELEIMQQVYIRNEKLPV